MRTEFDSLQSQNDYQREYLELQDEYIYRQLMREGLPESGQASCGHPLPAWRCLTCHTEPTFCTQCCRNVHAAHPLHHVEFWEGSYYRPAWLRQVGVQVHCGHNGAACPNLQLYPSVPQSDTVMPSLDPSAPAPKPVVLPHTYTSASEPELDPDNLQADEEVPYMVEETNSDFEDEDGDIYYGSESEKLMPHIADLPSFGEGPHRSPPSLLGSDTFQNDRHIVVVDIEGKYRPRPSRPESLADIAFTRKEFMSCLLPSASVSTHPPKTYSSSTSDSTRRHLFVRRRCLLDVS